MLNYNLCKGRNTMVALEAAQGPLPSGRAGRRRRQPIVPARGYDSE